MARSRGQIVLVAAFAMALIFVALALILNTAIFTENLATRETADGHDVIDFHDSAVEAGTVLFRATNEAKSNYTALVSTYRNRIDNYSDAELAHGLTRGTLRRVRLRKTKNGTRLNQSDGSTFESDRGNSTWQLAQGVTDTRAGVMAVTHVDSNATFLVNATNGTASWELAVEESNGSFDVALATPANGTSTRSFNTTTLEIHPTNGSIENESWADLTFQETFPDGYDLWIENGSNATGNFRLTVDKTEPDINWTAYNYDETVDPRKTPAIYNATLQIELLREDLEYRANVTVEPEDVNPSW